MLLLAVDALGILAQGRLQAAGGAQHHFLDVAPVRVHGHGQPADRVAGAGVHVDGRDAAGQGVVEAGVKGVHGVNGPHRGHDADRSSR